MGILDAHFPNTEDLDTIAQMPHVKGFQITIARKGNNVTCGWRAVANDKRYEASIERGDSIGVLVARARAQLAGLANGDDSGLREVTGRRDH